MKNTISYIANFEKANMFNRLIVYEEYEPALEKWDGVEKL